MLTALTEETIGHLQLGAGVFLMSIDLDSPADPEALRREIASALTHPHNTLGYTTGGGWFRCVPALRSPQQEARRPATLDDTILDGWSVTLTGTLVELTPERLRLLLPGSQIQRTGRVAALTLSSRLNAAHYLPQLVWVGDTTRGLVAIELNNALSVPGAAFHFVDRGEGTLPFEFRASCEAGSGSPCRVLFLE